VFTAFCLREAELAQSRIGFTTPRALGAAAVRNRIRRRVREAVRGSLHLLGPYWSIVINPRKKALDCPFEVLEREVQRLIARCAAE
jgi:ribonuclease P protein component